MDPAVGGLSGGALGALGPILYGAMNGEPGRGARAGGRALLEGVGGGAAGLAASAGLGKATGANALSQMLLNRGMGGVGAVLGGTHGAYRSLKNTDGKAKKKDKADDEKEEKPHKKKASIMTKQAANCLMISELMRKQAERSYHQNPALAAADPTGISAYMAGGAPQMARQGLAGMAGGAALGLPLAALGALHLGTRQFVSRQVGKRLPSVSQKLIKLKSLFGELSADEAKLLKLPKEDLQIGGELIGGIMADPHDKQMKALQQVISGGLLGSAGATAGSSAGQALQAQQFNQENSHGIGTLKRMRDRLTR